MAVDLRVSIRRGIAQLKRTIGRRRSELAALNQELKKHGRVYQLLTRSNARRRRPARKARRGPRLNWNGVLKQLPSAFTISRLAGSRAVRGKSKAYLRQVVVRWAKLGKVKRTGRGKYQKA
jgi:hypothetical protein